MLTRTRVSMEDRARSRSAIHRMENHGKSSHPRIDPLFVAEYTPVMSPPPPHRKRIRHSNDPGHAHFLTFSCYRCQPFLARDRTRNWLIDSIRQSLIRHNFALWAYVIMPEHVHLLIWPMRDDYDISSFLKSAKESVAKRAVAYVRKMAPDFLPKMLDRQPSGRKCYRFWQRGPGYDRNLWSPEHIWDKIDYIHGNPVQRGLCQRPEDWIWSSAADYLGVRLGLLPLDRTSLPADLRQIGTGG